MTLDPLTREWRDDHWAVLQQAREVQKHRFETTGTPADFDQIVRHINDFRRTNAIEDIATVLGKVAVLAKDLWFIRR